jgi:cellulose biosynthesis protein BcsQ
MGQIATFYSFKGGVGRSMALANTAVLLAHWGHRVLVLDWDLEAPGIESYFRPFFEGGVIAPRPGLVELLRSSTERDAAEKWRGMIMPICLPKSDGFEPCLHIITSGERSEGYISRVRNLDIGELYARGGGGFLERLRDAWKEEYDFTLVDSRTGYTDIGGLCTIQMPDILVLLFTANDSSLDGVIDVAKRADAARQKLRYDRLRLLPLPVPSRFDTVTEHKLSQEWLDRFASRLMPFYSAWLPRKDDEEQNGQQQEDAFLKRVRRLLELIKIPYKSYFSFGETLPVIEEGTLNPTGLGHAYATLAALIANKLENAERLLSDRDAFVRSATKTGTIVEGAVPGEPTARAPVESQVASDVLDGLSPEDQRAARRLFTRLVQLPDDATDGPIIPRAVASRELDRRAKEVLPRFVEAGLLALKPFNGGEDRVEVVHESLVRSWKALRDWVEEDRAFLSWRQRLAFLIDEWERSGRDRGALLRGARLLEAREFGPSSRENLNERELEYLAKSEAASRRLRHLVTAAAALALVMAGGCLGFLVWTRSDLYQIQQIKLEASSLLTRSDDSDTRRGWLVALALGGGSEEAMSQAAALEDSSVRIGALTSIADVQVKAGQMDQARQAALEASRAAVGIQAPKSRVNELLEVARTLAKVGLGDEAAQGRLQAEEAAISIEDPRDRSSALVAVAGALAEAGLPDKARHAASQALEAAIKVLDPENRSSALVAVAGALAEAGVPDKAGQAASQALEAATKVLDPETRSDALISVALALAKTGLTDRAVEAALRAKDSALAIQDQTGREKQLAYMMRHLADAGAIAKADSAPSQLEEAFQKIQDPGRLAAAWGYFVRLMANGGRTDIAKKAGMRATEAALKIPDPERRQSELRSLSWDLAVAGLETEAIRTATAIEAPGDRSAAMILVCGAMAERGAFDSAMGAAAQIRDPETQVRALTSIAATAIDKKEVKHVEAAARRAKDVALKVTDLREQSARMNDLARQLARAGMEDQAAEVARLIQGDDLRPGALLTVAEAMAKAGKAQQAKDLALEAGEAARKSADPDTLTTVAVFLAQVGASDQAAAVALEAEGAARKISRPQSQADSLISIARAMASAKSTEQARKTALEARDAAIAMADPGARTDTLLELDGLDIIDSLDLARASAEKIMNTEKRSAARANLAAALARRHRFKDARTEAESCDLPKDRLRAFTAILNEYTKTASPQMSKLVEEQMKAG